MLREFDLDELREIFLRESFPFDEIFFCFLVIDLVKFGGFQEPVFEAGLNDSGDVGKPLIK